MHWRRDTLMDFSPPTYTHFDFSGRVPLLIILFAYDTYQSSVTVTANYRILLENTMYFITIRVSLYKIVNRMSALNLNRWVRQVLQQYGAMAFL